jgi:hypothetical protein
MAVLSAPFDVGIKEGWEVRMKMAAVKIYQGGAVGVVAGVGYATPLLVATSGMEFAGVAEETVDNSTGSAGDKWIRVRRRGLVGFNSSGVTVANLNNAMYFVSGSDDNTVSATASAIFAGYLAAFDSNGVAWVAIDGAVANYGTANANAVTSEPVISGGTFQGVREISLTKNYPLGTKRTYADGRIFRYVYAAEALEPEFGCLSTIKTITNAVAPAQATGAGAVDDYKVTCTVASGDGITSNGAVLVNSLAGGYVVIGNGGSQHPQNRMITANTAVNAGGGVCTLTLDEPLDTVVLVGGSGVSASNIEVLLNRYAYVKNGNTSGTGYQTFIGLPARRIPSTYYGWVQTQGILWGTSDNNTCNSDGDRQIYFANNGSFVSGNDVTGDVNVQQLAGHAVDASSNGGSNAPFVDLCCEVLA